MGKRTLKVSPTGLLLNMGKGGLDVSYRIVADPVPSDAKIVALTYNIEQQYMEMTLESETFDGDEGQLIPVFVNTLGGK